MPDPIKPEEDSSVSLEDVSQPDPSPPKDTATATEPTTTTDRTGITEVAQPRSPLLRQHRDPRGRSPDYDPIQIIFLSGAYKGKVMDLGFGVQQVTGNQYANWETAGEDGQRVGVNFKNIGAREFSFSLEYYDLGADVIHLIENVTHLQEITGDTNQPPFLMLVWGSKNISPIVCSEVRYDYDNPHSEKRGFRHAKIDLTLNLYGGKTSEHASGKPLVATPLGDERSAQTDLERQRQGSEDVNRLLLLPCVGEKGSDQLEDLIQDGRLADPQAVKDLEANAMVQAAIAGLIPADVLADPAVKDRLAINLAAVMARHENGVGTSIYADTFARSLISGNPAGLPPDLANQLPDSHEHYTQVLEALQAGDLDPLLKPGQAAGEKLRSGFGSCGMSVRTVADGSDLNNQQEDPQVLSEINDFLGSASDEDIKTRFDIEDNQVVQRLKNGQPYQSKGEFVQFVADAADGSLAGHTLWNSFASSQEQESDDDQA